MDNDTETRRLSPVAIISDNGYLDLINGNLLILNNFFSLIYYFFITIFIGPQDHGWCGGYTCKS
jgi:hypothetical protein